MRKERIKLAANEREVACIECEGAGTVPDNSKTFKVRLCPSCNGHGIVLVTRDFRNDQIVSAYTATKGDQLL